MQLKQIHSGDYSEEEDEDEDDDEDEADEEDEDSEMPAIDEQILRSNSSADRGIRDTKEPQVKRARQEVLGKDGKTHMNSFACRPID